TRSKRDWSSDVCSSDLGGNNGFATGANNLGQVVGWAETGFHDPTCCCQSEPGHQVLQFLPAVWDLGSGDQIHDLPLIPGDTSGEIGRASCRERVARGSV